MARQLHLNATHLTMRLGILGQRLATDWKVDHGNLYHNVRQASQVDLDQFIVRNIEELAFEASDWEAEVLLEVVALPRVAVTRPPDRELLAIGMRRNDCHANCAAQAANDPEGRSRHVWGWYPHSFDLIFHSVVEIEGQWLCLTPQATVLPSRFEFITDRQIEWCISSNGSTKEAFRGGRPLPQALRKYPLFIFRCGTSLRRSSKQASRRGTRETG